MKRACVFLAAVLTLAAAAAGPELLSPENRTSVPLLRADWKALTEQRKMLPKTSEIFKENLHFPLPVDLSWRGGKGPYTLELTGGSDNRRFSGVTAEKFRIVNLQTGTDYRWSVTDASGARGEGVFRTEPGPRLIQVPDAAAWPVNLRDLGGRVSSLGGKVCQGLVYRGSHMRESKKMSEENRRFMVDELKIKTELDLRYESVIKKEKRTKSNLGDGVTWIHCPVNAYKSFTPEQNDLFRNAIRVFARPEAYPVYVHCQGGVDRTGEICFLLSALAGVSEDDLLTDYELSSLSRFPRSREKTVYFRTWREKIASFAPDKNWSERAERYLLSIGVTETEIGAIKDILLGRMKAGVEK